MKGSTDDSSSNFSPSKGNDSSFLDQSEESGKIQMRVEIGDSEGNFSSNFKKLEISLDKCGNLKLVSIE